MASIIQTTMMMMMVMMMMGCSADKKLIESVCDTCPDKAYCVELLESDEAAMEAKEKMGVLKAAVKMIIEKTKTIVKKGEEESPAMRKCDKIYGQLLSQLDMIYSELADDNDEETAGFDMGAAGDYLDECDYQASRDPKVLADNDTIRRMLHLGAYII